MIRESAILIMLLLSSFSFQSPQSNRWSGDWAYVKEIDLPIDTSLNESRYQPIDIRIEFENPCWARNEKENSIRVVCLHNSKWYELESQIYNLEYTDDEHISSCNLVFLIPGFADGREKYYVYYDDKERPPANYPDHINVSKEHYYYEPIPGQKADIDYYKIMDDGVCVYGVGIDGMMMTEHATQIIFSQSKDQRDFSYRYWDRLTSFCFQYQRSDGKLVTTREKLLSTQIYVDGNLMVAFGIESSTADGKIKTKVIYKCYHSNNDVKRMCVKVEHEILEEMRLPDRELGSFVFSAGFKTRSEANPLLNTGEILPYLHIYSEKNDIQEVKMDTNPRSRKEERIIAVDDDVDLGEEAWISIDEGIEGKAHGIIFAEARGIVKSGENEMDGIQVIAAQKQEVDIPGLKAYSSGIDCCRNGFVNGKIDGIIPEGYKVEFDAEFLTTQSRGYTFIERESKIYRALIKCRPSIEKEIDNVSKEKELYDLTAYVHLCPAFPFGALLSAATGKNFSYVYANLYRNESLVSSGVCSRIPLAGGLNVDVSNLSLKSIIGLFNWSDLSIFKKVRFRGVEKGYYLIKVYRRVRGKDRFVGVKAVKVESDKKIHVYCTGEGRIEINVKDQNGKGIDGAECYVKLEGLIVEKNLTKRGKAILKVPRGKYNLFVVYKGFLLLNEEIKVGLFGVKREIEEEVYDLKLRVVDKLGLPPGVKEKPVLSSDEMEEKVTIGAERLGRGNFIFRGIPSARYDIIMRYGSFEDRKSVDVSKDMEVEMVFSPLFRLSLDVLNNRGLKLDECTISISREEVKIEKKVENGHVELQLPPGKYMAEVYFDNKPIGKKGFDITRDEDDYILTIASAGFPIIVQSASMIALILLLTLFLLGKLKRTLFLRFSLLILILISVTLPWWSLHAYNGSTERFAESYLLPQTIVTITYFPEGIFGEVANIPEDFFLFIRIILIMTLLGGVIFTTAEFFRGRKKLALAILGLIMVVVAMGIYPYGMNELLKIGMHGLIGSGELNVENPFTNDYENLEANWGLSGGFYLALISSILMIFLLVIELKVGAEED